MQNEKVGLGFLFLLVALIGVPTIIAALCFYRVSSPVSALVGPFFLFVGLMFFVKGLIGMLGSKRSKIFVCIICAISGAIYVVVMVSVMLLLAVFLSRD
jgi:hypothetical protein